MPKQMILAILIILFNICLTHIYYGKKTKRI